MLPRLLAAGMRLEVGEVGGVAVSLDSWGFADTCMNDFSDTFGSLVSDLEPPIFLKTPPMPLPIGVEELLFVICSVVVVVVGKFTPLIELLLLLLLFSLLFGGLSFILA